MDPECSKDPDLTPSPFYLLSSSQGFWGAFSLLFPSGWYTLLAIVWDNQVCFHRLLPAKQEGILS